jgi:hypothetical protein
MSDRPRIAMDFNETAVDELLTVLEGCPHCDYDEAEGGLMNHCDACCRRVTALTWELFERPR